MLAGWTWSGSISVMIPLGRISPSAIISRIFWDGSHPVYAAAFVGCSIDTTEFIRFSAYRGRSRRGSP